MPLRTFIQSIAGTGTAATTALLSSRPAAQALSDTDAWPLGQPSQIGGSADTLWRGTLAQVWTYLAGKLPSYRVPVVELSGATTLDGPTHNRRLLVATTSLTLSLPASFANLTIPGAAFEAALQIETGATVTLPTTGAGTITAPATLAGPVQSTVRAWTTSGGVTRLSVAAPPGGTAATSGTPGLTVSGLSPLSAGATGTVTLSYVNGAPAGLTATIDGTAVALGSVNVAAPTSGAGATATGTATATLTVPAAGAHSLVVSGTGTYAAASGAYAFTATAAAAPGATATFPANLHLFFHSPSQNTSGTNYNLAGNQGFGCAAFVEANAAGTGGWASDSNNNSGTELTGFQALYFGLGRSNTSMPTNTVTVGSDPGGDGSFMAATTRAANGLYIPNCGATYGAAHPGTYYLWARLIDASGTEFRAVWGTPVTASAS